MRRASLVLVVMALGAACFEPPAESPADVAVVVGENGGRVFGDVMALEIPPGALAADTLIRVTRVTNPPPGVPGRAIGPGFILEPEGLKFAKPCRLAIQISDVDAKNTAIATAAQGSSVFTLLPTNIQGASAVTAITHFSYFVPVVANSDAGVTADAGVVFDAGPPVPTWPDPENRQSCIYADAGNWCLDDAGSSRACAEAVLAGCTYRIQELHIDRTHVGWGENGGHIYSRSKFGGEQVHVADGGGSVSDVGLEGGWVYYAGLGGIYRAPIDGGTAQRVVAPPAGRFALNATHIFWVGSNGSINRALNSGGTPEAFVSGEAQPTSVATDATHVYWLLSATGAVRRVPNTGGAPVTLSSGTAQASRANVVGGHVYWAQSGFPSSIFRVAVAGGATETLVTSQTGIRTFATDGNTLVWATGNSSVGGPFELMRKPVVGGASEHLLTIQLDGALGRFLLGIDESNYYIGKSALWRLPR